MEPKLFNYYSIDECINEEKLYSELDKFVDNGSLQYKLQERHILKMSDLDLTEDDIEKISNLFDALDVFPYLDLHDDEDDFHEGDYGDDEY